MKPKIVLGLLAAALVALVSGIVSHVSVEDTARLAGGLELDVVLDKKELDGNEKQLSGRVDPPSQHDEGAGRVTQKAPPVAAYSDAEIRAMRDRLLSTSDWRDATRIVRQLLALNSEDAIQAVLEFSLLQEPYFVHRARFLADALDDVEDPLIPEYAQRALLLAINAGHDDATSAGFARLVVRKGTVADALGLVDLTVDQDIGSSLRYAIVREYRGMSDAVVQDRLLDLLKERATSGDRMLTDALAGTLGEIRNQAVSERLLQLAGQDGIDRASRGTLYEAYGRSIGDLESLDRFVGDYLTLPEDEKALRILTLDPAIGGVDVESSRERFRVVYPAIEDGLLHGEDDVFLSALSTAGGHLDLAPMELAAVLRVAANRAPAEVYRKRAITFANRIEHRNP